MRRCPACGVDRNVDDFRNDLTARCPVCDRQVYATAAHLGSWKPGLSNKCVTEAGEEYTRTYCHRFTDLDYPDPTNLCTDCRRPCAACGRFLTRDHFPHAHAPQFCADCCRPNHPYYGSSCKHDADGKPITPIFSGAVETCTRCGTVYPHFPAHLDPDTTWLTPWLCLRCAGAAACELCGRPSSPAARYEGRSRCHQHHHYEPVPPRPEVQEPATPPAAALDVVRPSARTTTAPPSLSTAPPAVAASAFRSASSASSSSDLTLLAVASARSVSRGTVRGPTCAQPVSRDRRERPRAVSAGPDERRGDRLPARQGKNA
jgi:hypothetical protein